MNEFDGFAILLGNALQVHQARRVGAGDILGTGSHVTTKLVLAHTGGDSRFFDREHTAEAAAFIGALGLHHGDAFDELKKVLDLVEPGNIAFGRRRQAEFANAMTTVVGATPCAGIWPSAMSV